MSKKLSGLEKSTQKWLKDYAKKTPREWLIDICETLEADLDYFRKCLRAIPHTKTCNKTLAQRYRPDKRHYAPKGGSSEGD